MYRAGYLKRNVFHELFVSLYITKNILTKCFTCAKGIILGGYVCPMKPLFTVIIASNLDLKITASLRLDCKALLSVTVSLIFDSRNN